MVLRTIQTAPPDYRLQRNKPALSVSEPVQPGLTETETLSPDIHLNSYFNFGADQEKLRLPRLRSFPGFHGFLMSGVLLSHCWALGAR